MMDSGILPGMYNHIVIAVHFQKSTVCVCVFVCVFVCLNCVRACVRSCHGMLSQDTVLFIILRFKPGTQLDKHVIVVCFLHDQGLATISLYFVGSEDRSREFDWVFPVKLTPSSSRPNRGQSCADACPQFGCDLALIGSVNAAGLNQLQPFLNCGDIFALNPPAVSLNNGGGCTFQQTDSQTNQPVAFTCEEGPPFVVDNVVRVCACLADPGPGVAGDPHIHSMRGAHYTLLQEGIFVAWNFSKAVPAVPAVPGAAPTARGWELLAAYAGNRFTTQGLMLLDRHSGKSMEITAEDCTWRVKEKSSWRKAQLELLTAEDGSTSFQVKKLHEKLVEAKVLRSAILLKMAESGSDMKNMARLVVHCRPNYHLDFKMSMFQKSDINHVGGELGVAPDANHNYHFLFSKHGMMQMRADQEFKAGITQRHLAQDGDTCMSRLPVPQSY